MTTHPSPAALARYADPRADLDEVTMWSVEAHLEDCADCRARLAVGPDLLEGLEVLQIALLSRSSDAADCLGAIAIVVLRNINHLRFFKYAEMPVQISIGQRAQLFEVAKSDSFWMGDE